MTLFCAAFWAAELIIGLLWPFSVFGSVVLFALLLVLESGQYDGYSN